MSNTFGKLFKMTSFGESHGDAVGCIVDGCPAGITLSEADIQIELDKRKPGNGIAGTKRNESDKIQILSGIFEGKTTGTPIALITFNKDQNSKDYSNIKNVFRPGHADFTYEMKYGVRDYRGGGRSSARETLARVAAGAIAKKILASEGIDVRAYVKELAGIKCENYSQKDIDNVYSTELRMPDKTAEKKAQEKVLEAIKEKNSVGGTVEVIATGVPAGLGEPVYEKLSSEIASALIGINAAKGIEIGSGFGCSKMKGSEHNDIITSKNGKISFLSNNAGGILGGISTGQDIIARVAFKPLASIAQKQKTINTKLENTEIEIEGRHDVSVCPRAVPVVEAMMNLVLINALMELKARK